MTLDTIGATADARRESMSWTDRSVQSVSVIAAGTRIGDYILGDRIATGGFGAVYRAEHALFGTPAAVKVLHPELALTREAVIRFEREVQAIRRIDHPNVVRIFDFGEIRGSRPYFAMELLSGQDLETYLRSSGRISPDEALSILEPVCEALSAAHESSIIHRDFKASNVFLSESGERRRVVLLDFGVAKLLDESGPGITTSSHILGTPACMAPEQITGQSTDARTDIYALGALAYYMLTGELPFLDSSLVALLHMHLYSRPPAPSREAPVSPVFDDVIFRAMAKDPAARYQTVAEFIEAFRGAVEAARAESTPNAPRGSLLERKVAAIYIEVCADARAMEDPDESLLNDMERILPLAVSASAAQKFDVAMETGNTMLLVSDLGDDPWEELAARHTAVKVAQALEKAILEREGRDPRVYVVLCMHAGTVFSAGSRVVGGELLDLSTWVPSEAVPGLVATEEVVRGIGLALEPVEGSLYRIRSA
jgi:serine/threonine-protein kinase